MSGKKHSPPGTAPFPDKPVFEPGVDVYLREADAEYKILEEYARRLGPPNPNLRGRIDIFTELPACSSCSDLPRQFRERYPNIDVRIFSE